jgi:splicing factor 1
METESGAKIAIRGKGSVKEGKGKSDAAHASNQDEDLHCLIMADTEEKVNKAKKLIHNVIETVSQAVLHIRIEADTNSLQAASIPEGQNELKRNQLRELAALNGTLRDDENQACQNCGEIGHRKYDCPNARNFTANIICRVCGNAGHMARDCPDRVRGGSYREIGQGGMGRGRAIENSVDSEYEKMMNELGGGGGDGPPRQIGWEENGARGNDNSGAPVPPWARGATGAPPPWARGGQQQNPGYNQDRGGYGGGGYNAPPSGGAVPPWQQQQKAAPPWAGGGGGGSGMNGNMGGGYGYGGGQGYGGQAPPWQQPQQQYGVPPPPPGDIPPPPPPDDVPPPPPPPQS